MTAVQNVTPDAGVYLGTRTRIRRGAQRSAPHQRGCPSYRATTPEGSPRLAPGDIPESRAAAPASPRSAPRAQGCTDSRLRPRVGRSLRPARAGVNPSRAYGRSPCRASPRARGDVPGRATAKTTARRSAPRARGCTIKRAANKLKLDVCPARAGMYQRPTAPGARQRRLPRACGDGPGTTPVGPEGPPGAGMDRDSRAGLIDLHSSPGRAGMCPPRAWSGPS